MRSIALIVPVLLLAGLAAPRAQAQVATTPTTGTTGTATGTATGVAGATGNAFPTNISKVSVGPLGSTEKEKIDPAANVWLGQKACEDFFDFQFLSISPRVSVMELWVSLDASTDCSTAAARSVASAGISTTCWKAGTANNLQGKSATFKDVAGVRIFDQQRTLTAEPTNKDEAASCPDKSANNVPYYLWFVPLNSVTVANANPAPSPTGLPYRVRFNLFTATPETPQNVKTGSGESSIKVSWDSSADGNIHWRAFFEVRPDGDCTTGAFYDAPAEDGGAGKLKLGSNVVVDNTTVFGTSELMKPSAALTDLDGKKIPLESTISVAVAAEDLAGNLGPLSPPQCVRRIETISALDACGTPADCGLETCGLSPASRGSWFGLSLFVLSLAALIRRRTA